MYIFCSIGLFCFATVGNWRLSAMFLAFFKIVKCVQKLAYPTDDIMGTVKQNVECKFSHAILRYTDTYVHIYVSA